MIISSRASSFDNLAISLNLVLSSSLVFITSSFCVLSSSVFNLNHSFFCSISSSFLSSFSSFSRIFSSIFSNFSLLWSCSIFSSLIVFCNLNKSFFLLSNSLSVLSLNCSISF